MIKTNYSSPSKRTKVEPREKKSADLCFFHHLHHHHHHHHHRHRRHHRRHHHRRRHRRSTHVAIV